MPLACSRCLVRQLRKRGRSSERDGRRLFGSSKQDVVGDVGTTLWVLMGTIGIVLLMACANVANLLLVRADARRQEFAIRAALGARWTRVARQLLVESLTLGVLGGALGLGARLRAACACWWRSGPRTCRGCRKSRSTRVVLGFAVIDFSRRQGCCSGSSRS